MNTQWQFAQSLTFTVALIGDVERFDTVELPAAKNDPLPPTPMPAADDVINPDRSVDIDRRVLECSADDDDDDGTAIAADEDNVWWWFAFSESISFVESVSDLERDNSQFGL